MTRKREKTNYDRFLHQRQENYYYKRRVPVEVADMDERAPHVRIALKTDDIAIARVKRDALEIADNEYWASLLSGGEAGSMEWKRDELAKIALPFDPSIV